jgi:hypothetical protein
MYNQKMNSYLKEIVDFCGIRKNLTTHLARHTFASVIALANNNNVSLPNVAKMLGHAGTNVTKHYAKILDSSIMRDMANVENCFSNIYQPEIGCFDRKGCLLLLLLYKNKKRTSIRGVKFHFSHINPVSLFNSPMLVSFFHHHVQLLLV